MTTDITQAADRYARELRAAVNANQFSTDLRNRVERVLGWNADMAAANIPKVWAERFTEAADLIADTRQSP